MIAGSTFLDRPAFNVLCESTARRRTIMDKLVRRVTVIHRGREAAACSGRFVEATDSKRNGCAKGAARW